jgi:hypothetical protein
MMDLKIDILLVFTEVAVALELRCSLTFVQYFTNFC